MAPTKRKQAGEMRTQGRTSYRKRTRPANWGRSPANLPLQPSQEKKVSDIAVATYQVNTTGTFTPLHIPVLGSDYTNRIGRKTVCKSVYIRGFVTAEGANVVTPTTAPSQLLRMIVFIDQQPTPATAIAVGDLLNTAHPASQLNLNNRDRFRIVKDKQWVLDPFIDVTTATSAQASAANVTKAIKCYAKLNMESIFNATNGGTIADLNSGALYMFWIGSTAAGANVDANAVVSTRVRFLDA